MSAHLISLVERPIAVKSFRETLLMERVLALVIALVRSSVFMASALSSPLQCFDFDASSTAMQLSETVFIDSAAPTGKTETYDRVNL